MIKFDGKLVILGCGSVAQCVLAILFELIDIRKEQILIIDPIDNKHRIDSKLMYRQERLTPQNYAKILSRYLTKGDFLLDLAVEIDTFALIEWCYAHDVLFLNTSIEEWNAIEASRDKPIQDQTLYMRRLKLELLPKGGPTAIVEHGANPGLVSHFTRRALTQMAQASGLQSTDFPRLAYELGIKVIHISEQDTQVSHVPRGKDEFVNTWSCSGFIEEAMAPAELGFGTHEENLPYNGLEHTVGPKNQILLSSEGCNSLVRSWVPSGELAGMIIRHGEAYTLSDTLSLYEGDKVIYRPTVHYAYKPCPDAIDSLKDLEANQWQVQNVMRILSDDIEYGKDELGCLLMGYGNHPWWIGSILDIKEARYLAPGQSATTLQVAVSIVAAMIYAIERPRLGFCVPDDLDHEAILEIALPYLGRWVSEPLLGVHLSEQDMQFTQLHIPVPPHSYLYLPKD